MAINNEMALPKMLRCHHIFCFCCFTKWFLGSKQNCPVCFIKSCIKDLKTVHFEAIVLEKNTELDFFLVQKNLKNNKLSVVGNEDQVYSQRVFSISFSKYEKMILREIEELQSVIVTDPRIIEFCQFVNMKLISNDLYFETPKWLGKRTNLTESKTYKEELVNLYQNSKGFNVFVHPVDFWMLVDFYKGIHNLPRSLTLKILSVQKMTKSNFCSKNWAMFSHLGKNCEFQLVHVDFSQLGGERQKAVYLWNLKEFEDLNSVKEYKRPVKKYKKSFDLNPEDEPQCEVKIYVKKRSRHVKLNIYRENKHNLKEVERPIKAEEIFESVSGYFETKKADTLETSEQITENDLIFPLFQEAKVEEVDIFQKMKEKDKEIKVKKIESIKKSEENDKELSIEYIKVNKAKKDQKQQKKLREKIE